MKKISMCLFAMLSVSAWANTPKGVTVSQSQFDGTKEITLKPYGTSSCIGFGKTCISVGALWRSASPDLIALDLHTLGTFQNMLDLQIMVDGELITAKRASGAYDHTVTGVYKQSFQRFIITKSDYEKILSSQKAWMKITVMGGQYIETNLIDVGKPTLAFQGLQRMASQI